MSARWWLLLGALLAGASLAHAEGIGPTSFGRSLFGGIGGWGVSSGGSTPPPPGGSALLADNSSSALLADNTNAACLASGGC